ncbi:MAG TPA: ThiF family adenylyltransferase [Acidobacteriaceae bacterium]|jgi:adenylyltransferase/sulfurtransferase|nr:ThiF family adenylyltransferase [Acidobacteriaceae bacterium]
MPSDESQGSAATPAATSHRERISDKERYSRQVLFPGIGTEGQQRLAAAHVAVIGCGAMGSASASLLARAGIGTITIIDRDFVEPSNLQRQILFDEDDACQSLPKAEAARRHIARFNSAIAVNAHIADLIPGNIAELLGPAGILLDATDNFETRYLLNDYAIREAKPWIYAAAISAYAATMNILPVGPDTPNPTACLACIFPKPPSGNVETCDSAGILSTAVNLAASIQVTEALKYLTGQPHLMRRTLLSFELWNPATGPTGSLKSTLDHAEISAASPRPNCEVCGQRIFTHLSGQNRAHITLCGRDSVQIHEHHRPVDFAAMRARLAAHTDIQDIRSNDLLLRFRRGPHIITLFPDGRAIVQGTTDVMLARSLYARFVGS